MTTPSTSKSPKPGAITTFAHYPPEPAHDEAWNSYVILRHSHDASGSFLDIFTSVRANRKAKGTATDEEQDLLRAMLSFGSAGLDAMVKQLIRDTLPIVIARQPGAAMMFQTFIEKRLSRGDIMDHKFLASVLTHSDPRSVLIGELVRDLTAKSLQSSEQMFRAAAFFDIPSDQLCSDVAGLKRIFNARNQIAHEIDIDFGQPNRNRRPRGRQQMIDDTTALFEVGKNFLGQVDARL